MWFTSFFRRVWQAATSPTPATTAPASNNGPPLSAATVASAPASSSTTPAASSLNIPSSANLSSKASSEAHIAAADPNPFSFSSGPSRGISATFGHNSRSRNAQLTGTSSASSQYTSSRFGYNAALGHPPFGTLGQDQRPFSGVSTQKPHMKIFPAPTTRLFNGPTDVEMEDAPPLETPPSESTPSSRQSTVKPDSSPRPPVTVASAQNRPKLVPKPPKDCNRHTPVSPKRDYASEVYSEEEYSKADPQYIGTWKGIRFYEPASYEQSTYCGYQTTSHVLKCGHWVNDPALKLKEDESLEQSKHCGTNCRFSNENGKPFNCVRCREIITTTVNTQLSEAANNKLLQAKILGDEAQILSLLTEFLGRTSDLKANITETLLWMLRGDRWEGRGCRPAKPPRFAKSVSMMIKELEEGRTHENWEKEHGSLNPPCKRKSEEAVEEPEVKKTKGKFSTVNEPIPANTRGTKRSTSSMCISGPIEDQADIKRVSVAPPIQFGEAVFASPSPSVIGALVRKRKAGEETSEDRFKRSRSV